MVTFGRQSLVDSFAQKTNITRLTIPARRYEAVAAAAPEAPVSADPYSEVKHRAHDQLLRQLDLSKLGQIQGLDLRRAVETAALDLLETEELSRQERPRVARDIADEVLGYGPLQPLLADPKVTEIMVNGPGKVWVERSGRLQLSDVTFRDDDHVLRIIERIILPIGRRIDESSPMVDARLPDGSRVNAVIPPLSLDGPTLTIRKFSRDAMQLKDLFAAGTFSVEMLLFLQACAEARLSMVISGGTGTGKTTLLNILSSCISPEERVVTIEDPCELQLQQPHVVRMECRPANAEGKGEITQGQLVKNALRMRPDRIIIGEVRGREAFDMLQAMNTGHEGSMTTVHANSPRDALMRVENMVLMANLDLPVRVIREQIASAINIVVQLGRFRDGSRRVTRISEVTGYAGDTILMHDLFVFEQQGVDANGKIVGVHKATGLSPNCRARIEQEGITLPPELFAVPGGRAG